VMKYYAHFGHKDFIICLGYRGDVIKNYFLTYNECLSNDFTLSEGGQKVQLMGSDIQDWKITFVETGQHANIGQRLKAVERYLRDEPVFLANYSDGLTDLLLTDQIGHFETSDAIGSFISVRPRISYHVVSAEPGGRVTAIEDCARASIRINGGYFILRREIFDYIREGEELVVEPFQRLVCERRLVAYEHGGFWMAMDTFKDRQELEDTYARGGAPWEVWHQPQPTAHEEMCAVLQS
jgi:glucose-1-phosphate cytidylyltransferase